jgi:hypothetical protein
MYKKQKAAAARAWANRHKLKPSTPPPETISEPLAAITIDADWEYDCGYEGGVIREDSNTEYQPGSSSDDSQWDAESLDEMSGDELKSNLQQQHELLAEVAALTVPTPYSQITAPKTSGQRWSKTEHWVIWATQCAQSNRMHKTLVIRRNFGRRLKHCGLCSFWIIQLLDK